MGPAATAVGTRSLFLDSPRNRGKNRPKVFPLGNLPTPKIICTNLSARLLVLCADSGLPARPSPLSACAPFRSHARGCVPRRDGKRFLSVLPETGWKLPHSRSRSQAATLMFRSSARRRKESRHAGRIPKGGALRRVFCPAFSARAEKGWPSETSPQTPIYDTAPAGNPAGAAFFDRIIWSAPESPAGPWQ